MPSKNSITAFKKFQKSERILPDHQKIAQISKIGRPKKQTLKRSYKITLSLTEKEGEILKEKAGLIPEATYIYSFLDQHGFFNS